MKPLAPNTLIQNRYLVVQLIGKGGMGEVYLAVDQRLGSAVALKRMLFTDEDALILSFEREAKTLARLRHPALTKVSDHFTENEHQYLVMEHISGDDLSKRLETNGKAFPLSWVLFWVDQLLDALSYLHSHEPPIIHRDIKPQNLKLTTDNHIILLDFGLAKDSVGETRLSSTGNVIAYTPNYASMEQIRGTGTTARSDIYALSATMYQLLSDTVPADALSRADSVLNSLPDPVTPLNELNAEVPASIAEIIKKGMNLSAEQRFANAKEMQIALREAYAQYQQGTAAETMAFNTAETPGLQSDIKTEQFSMPEVSIPVGDKTEVMPVGLTDENPVVETELPADFNATIPFGTPFAESAEVGDKTEVIMPEVSDVGMKTEVMPLETVEPIVYETQVSPIDYDFSEGDKTEVIPPPDLLAVGEKTEVMLPIDSAPVFEQTPFFEADATAQNVPVFDNVTPNQVEESYTPEMTVPIIDYGERVAELPNNETSNFVVPQEEVLPPPPVIETKDEPKAKAAKAGGGGKTFLILGVLALLGVLGIGAAGTGVYLFKPELLGLGNPTPAPTAAPTAQPTTEPTVAPTTEPTLETNTNTGNNSSVDLTNTNTDSGNSSVSGDKTPRPTQQPTGQPTVAPTKQPTQQPTVQPTRQPTVAPTKPPTVVPTKPPPTKPPTVKPSVIPTIIK